MKTGIWKYGVNCYGVKNKCRKTEFHSSSKNELGSASAENGLPSSQEAIERAKAWLAKNMKEHKKAIATATYWQIENGVETWEIMSKEHNLKFPIEYPPVHGVFALNSTQQIIG